MRLELALTLPLETRLIPGTRRVIATYLRELGVADDVTDDVVLALDEACTNVVRHAFPRHLRDRGCYRLSAHLDDDEIVVEVEDEGIGLADPEPPDVGPDAVSGRGLTIIRQLMTDVDVRPARPDGTGTRVRMRRTITVTSP